MTKSESEIVPPNGRIRPFLIQTGASYRYDDNRLLIGPNTEFADTCLIRKEESES